MVFLPCCPVQVLSFARCCASCIFIWTNKDDDDDDDDDSPTDNLLSPEHTCPVLQRSYFKHATTCLISAYARWHDLVVGAYHWTIRRSINMSKLTFRLPPVRWVCIRSILVIDGTLQTSSSAVAERPRDALCPSVVSFKQCDTSSAVFYYCYFSFRSFTTAYN